MILDLAYTSKSLYTSNLIRFRFIYLLDLGAISLNTRSFCYLVNALISIKSIYGDYDIDKADIHIREKF